MNFCVDIIFRTGSFRSFNRIRQVAPTAQERASYAGLCRAFLVIPVKQEPCSTPILTVM